MIALADPPKVKRRLRHPPPPADQVRVSFAPHPASPRADERLFGAFAALCRIAGDPAHAAVWQSCQRQARSLPSAY